MKMNGCYLIIPLTLIILVLVGGCTQTNTTPTPTPTTTPPPVISSLSPTCGPAGTVVLITGTGFGNTPGASTVKFFSGVTATVNSWSATSISVTVPAAATTGNVVVTVDGRTSNEVMFTNPCGGQPTQQPNPQQLSLKAVMPTH